MKFNQLTEGMFDSNNEAARIEKLAMYHASKLEMQVNYIKEVAQNKGIDLGPEIENALADIWGLGQDLEAAIKYDGKQL